MTLRVARQGDETPLADGGRKRSVADAKRFGELKLAAWRHDFAGGEAGTLTANPGETIAYVVAGAGSAEIDGRHIQLARESVIWLESGDRCRLEATDEGLHLLVAHAPQPV